MTLRDLYTKARNSILYWMGFKHGLLTGGVLMALYMGLIIAMPGIGRSVLEMVP